jgi:hypothetical protein
MENKTIVPTKEYTSEQILDLINKLGIKTKCGIKVRMGEFSIRFYNDDTFFNVRIDLELEFDIKKSSELRKKYPNAMYYHINGWDISIDSLRTHDIGKIELLSLQLQDVIKIASLFEEILNGHSALITNLQNNDPSGKLTISQNK